MASFKKLKLVSDDELERLKQKQISQYDPQLHQLAVIKVKIDKLLTENGLTNADQKVKLLQALQNSFHSIIDSSRNSATNELNQILNATQADGAAHDAALPPPPGFDDQQANAPVNERNLPQSVASVAYQTPSTQNLLSLIPSRSRDKVHKLLDIINKNPDILSKNESNEAVINGKTIPGSNIVDLIFNLFSRRNPIASPPIGLNAFNSALTAMKIPRSLVSDAYWLNSPKRKPTLSTKRKHPPGRRPKILRVYNEE